MFRQQPGEEAGFIISGDERKQHRGSERVDDGGRIWNREKINHTHLVRQSASQCRRSPALSRWDEPSETCSICWPGSSVRHRRSVGTRRSSEPAGRDDSTSPKWRPVVTRSELSEQAVTCNSAHRSESKTICRTGCGNFVSFYGNNCCQQSLPFIWELEGFNDRFGYLKMYLWQKSEINSCFCESYLHTLSGSQGVPTVYVAGKIIPWITYINNNWMDGKKRNLWHLQNKTWLLFITQ